MSVMPVPVAPADSPVVELRRYRLHPGRRDALIDLFERELLAPQEALGMQVLGPFRDLDDPDRFVWLRAFPRMDMRAAALDAFYRGPVWQRHRGDANATMIDSDDVHLLRPAWPDADLERFVAGATPAAPTALLAVTVCRLGVMPGAGELRFFAQRLVPALAAIGGRPFACLAGDPRDNAFPALPVHDDRRVLAWCTWFADAAAHGRHRQALARHADIGDALRSVLAAPPEVMRLAPTTGSHRQGRAAHAR